MYTDYTLKFADAAEAASVLYTEETFVQDDVVETYNKPKYSAIDEIGTIYKPTGKMLKVKGEEPVPEMKPIDGWHVNVRHAGEAPELDAYVIQVDNPVRLWG
jgi:hypothetical protein